MGVLCLFAPMKAFGSQSPVALLLKERACMPYPDETVVDVL